MECKFIVGQKVTKRMNECWCNLESRIISEGPEFGKVYVIANIKELEGFIVLFFEEFGEWNSYIHSDFNPVDEKKTDISIFNRMLIDFEKTFELEDA